MPQVWLSLLQGSAWELIGRILQSKSLNGRLKIQTVPRLEDKQTWA